MQLSIYDIEKLLEISAEREGRVLNDVPISIDIYLEPFPYVYIQEELNSCAIDKQSFIRLIKELQCIADSIPDCNNLEELALKRINELEEEERKYVPTKKDILFNKWHSETLNAVVACFEENGSKIKTKLNIIKIPTPTQP